VRPKPSLPDRRVTDYNNCTYPASFSFSFSTKTLEDENENEGENEDKAEWQPTPQV
jgi:hypothetical protein